MTSRVNTKFVVILSAVLLLVCGAVVAVGYARLYKGPEKLAAMGDQAAAEGDWEGAADLYSRAVFKDQTNPELLRLWVNALEKITPTSPQQYVDMYFRTYIPALRSLAEAGRTDVSLHRRYLDEHLTRLARFGASLAAWEDLALTAEASLRTMGESTPGSELVARYRGLARLGVYSTGTNLSPEHFEQTVADLKGALGADPSDSRAATALSELYRMRAARLQLEREDEAAGEYMRSAREELRAFVTANPESAEALLELLRLESIETARRSTTPLTYADLAAAHGELLEQMVRAARNAEPGSLRPVAVAMAASVVMPLPQYGREVAIEILDRAIGPAQDNANLLIEKADVELRAGNADASIALLQKVIDLKDRPLSLDGLVLLDQRTRAAAKQVDCVLTGWDPSKSEAERRAVIERARVYRDALAERIGAERPELDLIDAKLRYAAGDLDAARTLLSRYNDRKGNDPMAMTLLGDILQRQGSLGAARTQYERAAELRPGDARLLLALAGVDVSLREYAKAAERLRRVMQIDPGNEMAAEQLRVVTEMELGGAATDPVVAALRDVERLTSGVNPDPAAAVARVRAAIDEGGSDPRLVQVLAQLMLATGDRDGALAAAQAGATAHPEHQGLAEIVGRLSIEDPVAAALESIEKADATPVRKHLMRFELYSRAGKPDEARAELAAARALEPDSPMVLEQDFMAAVTAKDGARARAIAERATARNADNVNGLSYRARLSMMDEKYEDAASFLRQATEIDPYNPLLWRYLGETRSVLRQHERASEAFGKALEIRPTDVVSIKGLIRSRYATGKIAEALAAARGASGVAAATADPDFVELWVVLESSAAGGDRAKAMEIRRQMAARFPANRRNRAALVELLMGQRELSEARGMIDELRAEGDDLGLVELDARWQITSGNFQEAVEIFRRHIDGLKPEERSDTPHIVLARLLSNSGQPQAAMQVLEQSRGFQDPKVMAVDRELAELMFRMGGYEQALALLRGIKGSGALDEDGRMARGEVECLNRLGRHEEAEAALVAMGERANTDASLVLMRAQAAAGQGDRARARQLFDRAIALESTNPAGFFARAEFLSRDAAMMQDAEADMQQVVRLNPRYPGARRWLAQAAANGGRWEQAIEQLRLSVSENPDDDEGRSQLISVLIGRQRGAEAVDVLNQAIARRPDALHWLTASAEIHARIGAPERAVPHLERAWELSKTPEVAVAYVLTLTSARPPATARALQVLATPELGTERSLALMLTRARIRLTAGQNDAARQDLEAGYRLVDHSIAEQVGLFFNAAVGGIPDAEGRLRLLDSLAGIKPFSDWFLLNYATVRQQVPGGVSGLDVSVAPLADQREDADLALAAMAVLGQIHRDQGRFEEAAAVFKRRLDIVPDDANTNNNYAYVVGHDLGRAAEALPYAEKAVRLAPQNTNALHTLGALALSAGRLEQADTALARALSAAVSPQDRLPVYLAMGKLRLAQNNRSESERCIGHARDILTATPSLSAVYGAEFEALEKQYEAR